MEYVYGAMLLHSAGKEINEASLSGVLKSAGIEADTGKVKALITSLKDVDIDEAIKKAASVQVAAAPVAGASQAAKKEEVPEEEGKTEEQAAEGLGSLFG